LVSLDIRLSDTELKAPSAGVIQSRLIEPGEMVSPTRPAFTLALTDPKWVRAYVSEPDLGRVKEGQSATVISDSWPDQQFTGRIGFISPAAEFTPRSVETTDLRTSLVYEVRVWVEDPENKLRLGMPATVELSR
jgi:HlyD family secretion protein